MDRRDPADPPSDEEQQQEKAKRIDVSPAQVMGSAVAAVIAAFAAGQLGVYGTFIGAGVMSLVATSGGPLFQHFFRRTGEQIKVVTVQQRPRTRRPAPEGAPSAQHDEARATTILPTVHQADETVVLRPGEAPRLPVTDEATAVHRVDPDETVALRKSADPDATTVLRPGEDPEATRLFAAVPQAPNRREPTEEPSEEFTESSVHGTKWRGWKRTLLPAVLVFGLAIGGVTLYEAISGHNVSGGKGTSVSDVFGGGGSSDGKDPGDADEPAQAPGETEEEDGDGGATPHDPSPEETREGDTAPHTPAPDPTGETGTGDGETGADPGRSEAPRGTGPTETDPDADEQSDQDSYPEEQPSVGEPEQEAPSAE
ncbi:hypothetical protein [Streptomyces xiaopingdaonensis]|uniref:hypothetical protein n=1 Tax=Streptomyces xiaopingdaonensis TaxID=1565415 RepID=UPI0002FF9A74|nr:hypothetical protein [Streptomyces xiaopingdaonensis]